MAEKGREWEGRRTQAKSHLGRELQEAFRDHSRCK